MNDENQNMLMAMLTSMDATKWAIAGVIILIAEVATGTTYLLWPALAALLVAIVGFAFPIGWEIQFLLFGIVSVILLIFGHKFVRPRMKGGEPSQLNDRARSMVGMRVQAVTDFKMGEGRVQVGDTQWRARIEDGNPKAGDELKVQSVKGTTLKVITMTSE